MLLRVASLICMMGLFVSPWSASAKATLSGSATAGQMELTPSKLSFQVDPGQNPPPAQLVVSGVLDAEASVSTASGGPWLVVGKSPGFGDPTFFKVAALSSTLAPGTYNGVITITSSFASNSPQQVPVELTVGSGEVARPTIQLGTRTLTFNADQGSNPASQSFTVTNSGGGVLVWTATVSGAAWLTLTPSSGTAPSTVQVSIASSSLAPGTYAGSINITSSSSGITNSPQTISVLLTVRSARAIIALSPSSLSFSALPGAGPPEPQTVSLANSGGGTLTWASTVTTFSGGPWLSVTPSEGTAPSRLTVAVDISRLAIGRYAGSISVRSAGEPASNTPQMIPVELLLAGPRIADGGIVNAASNGAHGLSPGSLFSIYGTNLATTSRSATPGDPLPEELGGATVHVDNFRAKLLFVSPKQINAQVPVELTNARAGVRVGAGGLETASVPMNVLAFDPGLFTVSGEPGGPLAALHARDFGLIGELSPAGRGSLILLYATGLGPVLPSVSSGQGGSSKEPLNRTVETPAVLIGGKPARVLYSGLAPNFVGLYQVNVEVPADAPTGDGIPVVLLIGGQGSNTARLAIR